MNKLGFYTANFGVQEVIQAIKDVQPPVLVSEVKFKDALRDLHGLPEGEALITSGSTLTVPGGLIEEITLLGHDGALEFSQDEAGLHITSPVEKPCDHAYTFKITLKQDIDLGG